MTADPHATAELDAFWCDRGATWVQPARTPLRADDWLTPAFMADLLHINARSLRDWARRRQIRVMTIDGERVYNVGDVVAYMRKTRLRRASATMQP